MGWEVITTTISSSTTTTNGPRFVQVKGNCPVNTYRVSPVSQVLPCAISCLIDGDRCAAFSFYTACTASTSCSNQRLCLLKSAVCTTLVQDDRLQFFVKIRSDGSIPPVANKSPLRRRLLKETTKGMPLMRSHSLLALLLLDFCRLCFFWRDFACVFGFRKGCFSRFKTVQGAWLCVFKT